MGEAWPPIANVVVGHGEAVARARRRRRDGAGRWPAGGRTSRRASVVRLTRAAPAGPSGARSSGSRCRNPPGARLLCVSGSTGPGGWPCASRQQGALAPLAGHVAAAPMSSRANRLGRWHGAVPRPPPWPTGAPRSRSSAPGWRSRPARRRRSDVRARRLHRRRSCPVGVGHGVGSLVRCDSMEVVGVLAVLADQPVDVDQHVLGVDLVAQPHQLVGAAPAPGRPVP